MVDYYFKLCITIVTNLSEPQIWLVAGRLRNSFKNSVRNFMYANFIPNRIPK